MAPPKTPPGASSITRGQVCTAASRLLVEASIKDDFVARVAKVAKTIQPGDPFDPEPALAP